MEKSIARRNGSTTAPLNALKYPSIDVSFYIGWQKRGAGKSYNSASGDALLVAGRTRKPIALTIKSKVCNYCRTWTARNLELEVPPHDCTKNHVGSSSSMEPQACLEMVVDMFNKRLVEHC
jgi:hypothetical protein